MAEGIHYPSENDLVNWRSGPITPDKCPGCTSCGHKAGGDTLYHHWLEEVAEDTGEPIYICKHCIAWIPYDALPEDEEIPEDWTPDDASAKGRPK